LLTDENMAQGTLYVSWLISVEYREVQRTAHQNCEKL